VFPEPVGFHNAAPPVTSSDRWSGAPRHDLRRVATAPTALADGFGVRTTTVFRYIREGVDVLAAVAPTLAKPST